MEKLYSYIQGLQSFPYAVGVVIAPYDMHDAILEVMRGEGYQDGGLLTAIDSDLWFMVFDEQKNIPEIESGVLIVLMTDDQYEKHEQLQSTFTSACRL